jgi:hypothetical protein
MYDPFSGMFAMWLALGNDRPTYSPSDRSGRIILAVFAFVAIGLALSGVAFAIEWLLPVFWQQLGTMLASTSALIAFTMNYTRNHNLRGNPPTDEQ